MMKFLFKSSMIFSSAGMMLTSITYLSNMMENEVILLGKILLILISGLLTVLLLITSPGEKYSMMFMVLVLMTMIFIAMSFMVSTMFSFYIFFEISILPVVLLILGWGYQPERITASFYMFFYTLFGSLPLLLMILTLETQLGSLVVCSSVTSLALNSGWEFLSMSLAFLIKLPIYFTHLWLPKAHVEAPVAGSMILAGLMLKLGGLGLIFLNILICKASALKFILILSSMGGMILGCMISRLTDMKVMIAYSSVVHMSLVFVCSVTSSSQGLVGLILMMLCHGLTSPGMFSCANMMYERSHSRSSLINKGKMSTFSSLSTMWFLLIMSNFGGPFTINLMSEIFLINSASSIPLSILLFVAGMCFFSAMYNILLYATLHQGVKFFSMEGKNILVRENLLLSAMIIPGMLILLSSQII